MKKIILSALILSLAFAVQAQEGKTGRHGKGRHHGNVMEKLNLTEDQKAKMKTENEAFHKQMKEIKSNETVTVADMKSKTEAARKAHKAKVQSILTTEQKAQLEKMKSEFKGKREAGMKGRHDRMGDRSGKMAEKLNLTADQKAKMEKNREELKVKMKAIRDNSALDESAKKEKMKELMKERKESMKSILTDEQLKQLEENKKHHTDKRKVGA